MIIYVDENKTHQEHMDMLCTCGHKLYQHAFIRGNSGIFFRKDYLSVSQCTMCGFKNNNTEFVCEEFDPA